MWNDMGGIEFGKCDICGKETELERQFIIDDKIIEK